MNKKTIIIASAIMLALSGCGGSDDSTDSTDDSVVSYPGPERNLAGIEVDSSDMTAWDSSVTPEIATTTLSSTGEVITYNVVDGKAIFEGDINIGSHADIQENGLENLLSQSSCTATGNLQCSLFGTTLYANTWEDGIVPYTYSAGTDEDRYDEAESAMADWESVSNIRFVQRTDETDYVEFNSESGSCSSSVGRRGGMQSLYYDQSDGVEATCVRHEIGHALGFRHEQNRSDRDQYVVINWDNIDEGKEHNFTQYTTDTDVGDYDFSSLMHYPEGNFAIDDSIPTITAIDSSIDMSEVGGRGVAISDGDAEGVEYAYGEADPARYVTMRKFNSSGFAIDGGGDGENYQNVYIWTYNWWNTNQHWEEIDQGDGYYSYRKRFTSFCLDGGDSGSNRQSVYLYKCDDSNYNQQWKKIKKYKKYSLQKRNASGYSLNAGNGGSNSQDLYLFTHDDTDGNQLWYVDEVN